MIFEAICSTLDSAGQPNFAPMGLVWGEDVVTLRPFKNTQTYRNLCETGYAVANLTDDVLAFVRSGLFDQALPGFPAQQVPGVVYQETCSWLELAVKEIDRTGERAEVTCRVVAQGRQRDFIGFCRAQSAVLEATILATRLHLLDTGSIRAVIEQYEQIVNKTGGENEIRALQLVDKYIRRYIEDDRD